MSTKERIMNAAYGPSGYVSPEKVEKAKQADLTEADKLRAEVDLLKADKAELLDLLRRVHEELLAIMDVGGFTQDTEQLDDDVEAMLAKHGGGNG